MKRVLLMSLLALGGTFSAACAPEQSPQPDAGTTPDGGTAPDGGTEEPKSALGAELEARINAYVSKRIEQGRVPGLSLAIVKDGEPVFARGYGYADLEQGVPMTEKTRVSAGSTMKTVTALAVMQLVEDGLIDLEAPVTDYLPWFTLADGNQDLVLVKHILSHASGLPAGLLREGDSDDGALEAWVRTLEDVSLYAAPGTSFRYSNYNYSIAGLLVQAVSGQTFEAYVDEHIFEPAAMSHTELGLPEVDDGSVAQGYGWTRGALHPWVLFGDSRASHPAGSAFYVSAEDSAKYLAMLLAGGEAEDGTQIVSAASVERMWSAEISIPPGSLPTLQGESTYSFGFFSHDLHGETVQRHGGAAGSSGSDFILIPERDLAIAVLANLDSETKHEVALGVASMLLDEALTFVAAPPAYCAPSAFPHFAEALGADFTQYTGEYVVGGITGRVYLEEGRVLFAYDVMVPPMVYELEPTGLNAFVVRDPGGQLECLGASFVETPDGLGLLLSGAPAGVRIE